jgi:hypothetical protein
VGHVFVGYSAFSESGVLEFAHGGTSPIQTLSDPSGTPSECSVDPTSGALAVVNQGSSTVLIYPGASGSPQTYTIPKLSVSFVGYDDRGNLFADGLTKSYRFGLFELPHGGSSFKAVTLNLSPGTSGSVQWDGKYVTVTDTPFIELFVIRGMRGKLVSQIELDLPHDSYGNPPPYFTQTWIQGKKVIGLANMGCIPHRLSCPLVFSYGSGEYLYYLHGGSYGFGEAGGVTVSLPSS